MCLISSFSSDSIDFSLSVSSLFLEISKLLNFSLLFIFDSSFFHLMFKFSLLLVLDIFIDSVIFFSFFLFLRLFHGEIKVVGNFNLLEHCSCFVLFSSCSFFFFDSHGFYLSLHLLSFSFSHFTLFDSIIISFLNLINDDLFTHQSGLSSLSFSIFVSNNTLESFNFHHKIKFLLFFNIFLLELFGFFQLFISHTDNFSIEKHLIHSFNIIMLLVNHHLSLGKKSLRSHSLLKSEITWRHLGLSCLVKFLHLFLSHSCCESVLVQSGLLHLFFHLFLLW